MLHRRVVASLLVFGLAAAATSVWANSSTDAERIDVHKVDGKSTGKVLQSNGVDKASTSTDSPRFVIFQKKQGENSRAEFRFRNDFGNRDTITMQGQMRVLDWTSNAEGISVAQTLSDQAKPGDGAYPLSQLALDAELQFYEVHAPGSRSENYCIDPSTGEPASVSEGGSYVEVRLEYSQVELSSQASIRTSPSRSWAKCPSVTSTDRNNAGKSGTFGQLFSKLGAYHLTSGAGSAEIQWRYFTVSGNQ